MADKDTIGVTVSTNVKVTNPKDRYENATFFRSHSRTMTIAPPPENAEERAAYEEWVENERSGLTKTLEEVIDREIQQDVDGFYRDNGVEPE